jgi:uncharacterized membrane protein
MLSILQLKGARMSPQKIVSIVLLVVGVVMLVIGISSSDSFADEVSRTFTGRFTDTTQFYIVGGLVSAIVGLVMLGTGFGGKRA